MLRRMRNVIGLLALVSMLAAMPGLAAGADLDQRRTLLLDDGVVGRVVIEPLAQDAKRPKRAKGVGVVLFLNGLEEAPVMVKRTSRRGGKQIRYRIKPAPNANIRVRGSIRVKGDVDADTEELRGISLQVRGKAPRRRVKGVAGAEFVLSAAGVSVPAFEAPFVQLIRNGDGVEESVLDDLAVARDGTFVCVGSVFERRDGERGAVSRATRWTLRPGTGVEGADVDEKFLGPGDGGALALSADARVAVGRMTFPASNSSDALWGGDLLGVQVTSLGAPASGVVFEATHVSGSPAGELIAVLRVLTGGAGTVRWSSVSGETVLALPRETVSRTVRGMDASGDVLVGDASLDGRQRAPLATSWDAAGAVTLLRVAGEAASSARAVSPDGAFAVGVRLDLFRERDDDVEREPVDEHVIWDLGNPERSAVAFRTFFGSRTDVGEAGGPTAVTRSGLVAGWDGEGAFVWRAGQPEAQQFRAFLEDAGLALPRGERDQLKAAVDVVGGTVFAGTTRTGDGDRSGLVHWVAFVPTTD